jgi:hypothetical protein
MVHIFEFIGASLLYAHARHNTTGIKLRRCELHTHLVLLSVLSYATHVVQFLLCIVSSVRLVFLVRKAGKNHYVTLRAFFPVAQRSRTRSTNWRNPCKSPLLDVGLCKRLTLRSVCVHRMSLLKLVYVNFIFMPLIKCNLVVCSYLHERQLNHLEITCTVICAKLDLHFRVVNRKINLVKGGTNFTTGLRIM